MLKIEALELSAGQKKWMVIDHLQFEPCTFNAILGPNGAGKSTLLKLIAREIKTYTGSITLHNKNIAAWHRQQLARHLAVLPQSSQLTFPFTAYEVVNLGASPLSLSSKERRQSVFTYMEKLGCAELAQQSFMQLSGGQKQRVQLARVLLQLSQAQQPPLLLLDEPTSAQDLRQQHAILELVKSLASQQGYCVVAVLHELNHALNYTDQAYVLKAGTMVGCGSPKDILNAATIKDVWQYTPTLFKQEHTQPFIY